MTYTQPVATASFPFPDQCPYLLQLARSIQLDQNEFQRPRGEEYEKINLKLKVSCYAASK